MMVDIALVSNIILIVGSTAFKYISVSLLTNELFLSLWQSVVDKTRIGVRGWYKLKVIARI